MFTHPLDLTKVQMQTIKSNKLNTAQFVSAILRNHGVRGLYDGLTAAMLRALSYSTFRFGAYEFAKQKFLPSKPGMLQMVTASAAAGGMAGLLGVPAEVVLIRMASDRPRPPAERYGYKNGVQGLVRITKEEGVLALYRGVGPNVVSSHNVLVTAIPWRFIYLHFPLLLQRLTIETVSMHASPRRTGPSNTHERLPTRLLRLLQANPSQRH